MEGCNPWKTKCARNPNKSISGSRNACALVPETNCDTCHQQKYLSQDGLLCSVLMRQSMQIVKINFCYFQETRCKKEYLYLKLTKSQNQQFFYDMMLPAGGQPVTIEQ